MLLAMHRPPPPLQLTILATPHLMLLATCQLTLLAMCQSHPPRLHLRHLHSRPPWGFLHFSQSSVRSGQAPSRCHKCHWP
ncbi:hypothetical protein BC826DRAFT_1012484 [Russula brevipes]|nr:hypothetical protein BC826DRAFT_1012484 [Russula brevipes]